MYYVFYRDSMHDEDTWTYYGEYAAIRECEEAMKIEASGMLDEQVEYKVIKGAELLVEDFDCVIYTFSIKEE